MVLRRCCRWLGRLAKKVWFCVLSGLKTGIEYKASLGGGGCCKLQGLPRRGEAKTKSFDSSSKTVLEFKASLIAAKFAKQR